ncbi:MAG: RnfH family protein [Burkholderiaceae bacterium]
MIRVTLVFSPGPRQVEEICLELAPGATVAQALELSGMRVRFPELARTPLQLGIWGRKATLEQRLRDEDRVEIYRPLKVDPKVARRTRFARQGAGAAGLFARKRPGGKAGY